MREEMVALGEDIERRLRSVVQKQFRSPIEKIRLAGIECGGTFVLMNGFERVAKLFLNFSEQVMRFGFVVMDEQGLNAIAGTGVIAGLGIREREVVSAFVVCR